MKMEKQNRHKRENMADDFMEDCGNTQIVTFHFAVPPPKHMARDTESLGH